MTAKKVLQIAICIAIGICIGAFLAFAYAGATFAESLYLLKTIDIYRSSESSFDAYSHESPDIAVWALKSHDAVLRHHLSEGYPEKEIVLDLVITNARIAIKYGTLGSNSKKDKYLAKSLEYANRLDFPKIRSKEQLFAFVEKHDKATQGRIDDIQFSPRD